ncbi:hypothetical protein Hte_007768 [Hypoxylon texense]
MDGSRLTLGGIYPVQVATSNKLMAAASWDQKGLLLGTLLMPPGPILRNITNTDIVIGPLFRVTPGEKPIADPHFVESLDEDIEKAKALSINTPTRGVPLGDRDGIRLHVTTCVETPFVANEKEAGGNGNDEGQPLLAHEKLGNRLGFPVSEKTPPQQPKGEVEAMVVRFLDTAIRHLLANPAAMAKLRAELASHPPAARLPDLERFPYTGGVVLEAHRLAFGLTGRDAEDDGSFFPDPLVFDPERWLGQAGADRRQKFQPASPGGWRAWARMHLEMAGAIAAIMRWHMDLFEKDGRQVAFEPC